MAVHDVTSGLSKWGVFSLAGAEDRHSRARIDISTRRIRASQHSRLHILRCAEEC